MEYVHACVCERQIKRERQTSRQRQREMEKIQKDSDLESMEMDAIVLMLQYWKIKKPNILISLTKIV